MRYEWKPYRSVIKFISNNLTGTELETKKATWQEFVEVVNYLATEIKSNELALDAIYGIPRGGLCLATTLSHKLNIPLITKANHINGYAKVLVVDDISDTGKTLKKVVNKHGYTSEIITATWHYSKTNSSFEPDYYYADNNGIWIEYPWEW